MSTDAHTAIRKTFRGYLVALILVAVGLGCLHLLLSELRVARVYWFNLDKERNLPTWLSGMVFFLFGCSALVAWFWERRRNSVGETCFRYPILWLGVATVGWMMSLDEITILHENLWWKEVRLASQELGGGWVFLTQWQILFAPAVLTVVACFTVFFCNRYSASRAALLAAFGGIGCWIAAFLLEGMRGTFKWSGSTWYTVEVVLEEELELIGGILLLGSVVFYTLDIALDFSDQRRERLRVATRFLTGRAMAVLAIALCLLTGGAGVMYLLAQKQASGDAPIPALHERAKREASGRDRAALDDRRSGRPSVPSRAADKNIDPSGPDAAAVRHAITMSADYLVRVCNVNGRFVYRVNLDPRVTPKPKYNILRHAGTMYALAVYHEYYPDDRTRDALVRAGRFLRECCMAPVPDRDDLLAVWSLPQINGSSAPVQAKLGGTGLALVALLSLEEVAPGSTPPEQLRQLGSFVLYMQKEDGSFYSKYIPSEGGRQDKWTSLFYPGEAALGLLMLHERDPSPQWLQGATSALKYLARVRRNRRVMPADHWALLATARLLSHHESWDAPVDADVVVRHAIQICERILGDQVGDGDSPLLDGGFAADGRTTPTATRLEGLLAALQFIGPDQPELRKRIELSVHRGIAFLLQGQVREGDFAGGFTRAVVAPTGREDVLPSRATEVRIDYVQHAMCALIDYERMLVSRPGESAATR